MNEKEIVPQPETGIDWDTLEKVVVQGDLSKLSTEERLSYYRTVCESVGLNPATQPFEYLRLSNKLTLYPKRDATDQLRRIHRVGITIVGRERLEDVYIVTARATTPDGRMDESTGVVNINNLKGDNLANALMKAETKAKRRVTLSIVGLGMLDESELDTVRGAETFSAQEAHTEPPAITEQTPKPSDERRPVNLNALGAGEGHVPGEPVAIATDAQIKLISTVVKELGYSADEFKRQWLQEHYGVTSRKELTRDQASDLINNLKGELYGAKLDAATTVDELNEVAKEIKDQGVSGMVQRQLRERYSERMETLSARESSEGDPELDEAYEAYETAQAELA